MESLQWLRGPNYDIEPELKRLEASIRAQQAQASRFSDVFRWWAAKPLLVAIGLMFFQQMSGINAALFFSTKIFGTAGLDEAASQSATLGMGAMNVAMTVISLIMIERAGRKTLMLIGLTGMFLMTTMLLISLLLVVCSWNF